MNIDKKMVTDMNVAYKQFLNLVEEGAGDYTTHKALMNVIECANVLQMEIDPDPRAMCRREGR